MLVLSYPLSFFSVDDAIVQFSISTLSVQFSQSSDLHFLNLARQKYDQWDIVHTFARDLGGIGRALEMVSFCYIILITISF
jgi:hypothetical protein